MFDSRAAVAERFFAAGVEPGAPLGSTAVVGPGASTSLAADVGPGGPSDLTADLTADVSPVRPAGGLQAVAVLLAAADRLGDASRSCRAWSAQERAEVLSGLDRLAGQLASARAHLLAAQQAAGTGVGPGDRDFTAALARTSRSGYASAAREVAQARTLTELPVVSEAVSAGRVPLAHVEALARVAARASGEGAALLGRPTTQERLVGLAERLPVRDFANHVASMVAEHDPASLERSDAAAHAARFLHLSSRPDGTLLKGRLDPVAGEILRTALVAAGQAPDETRDKAQADADALVALARRACGATEPADDGSGVGSAPRPHVSVVMSIEALAELRAEAAGRRAEPQPAATAGGRLVQPPAARTSTDAPAARGSGDAPAAVPSAQPSANEAAPVATLEDGTPLARSRVAQVLCDCDIARIVVTAEGVPVDLGRTRRLYPASHRRAVVVRDRHCAWNGCAVPAPYCEVHHIRWWERDTGPTSLENAVLLCSHHHHVVHALDLGIDRQLVVPCADAAAGPTAAGAGGWAAARAGGPTAAGAMGLTAVGAQGSANGAVAWPREPMTYVFSGRGGAVVSAPPGASVPAAPVTAASRSG